MGIQPSDNSELGPEKFLSAGPRGEVTFLSVLAGIMVAIALLIVAMTDMEASRAFPLTFYMGGGLIVVGGFLSALEKVPYWYSAAQREAAFNMSYVYAALGVGLIAVGILLDTLF